jgi:hypothetical protein
MKKKKAHKFLVLYVSSEGTVLVDKFRGKKYSAQMFKDGRAKVVVDGSMYQYRDAFKIAVLKKGVKR